MKHLFLPLLFLIATSALLAQKPEPVYSFVRTKMPLSWYKQQSAAWQKVINENPKDAKAWWYYYRVTRNLHSTDTTDTRTHEEKHNAMQQIVQEMEKHVPETYEYNLVKWYAAGHGEDWSYLEKALKLGPERTEHLDGMMNKGEIERNLPERHKYANQSYERGQVSPGLMNYSYNMLAGLPPGAILFTAGDNDTYPTWALQAQGVRKDVYVVNLSLLLIDDYRSKLLKELGLGPWEAIWENPDSSAVAHQRFQKGIIRHMAGNSKKHPVYIALSATKPEFIGTIEDQLYITGLAYLYSPEPTDHIALMKKNFEQEYALDYIDVAFYHDISPDWVSQINRNYIVPMLKLYDHYKTAGDAQKEAWIKGKLLAVSKGAPEEQQVKQHLQK